MASEYFLDLGDILQSHSGTVLKSQWSGIGFPTIAVVYVERVAVSGLQFQFANGDTHGGHQQAIAPGKPEFTIQAKGAGLTSCYAIGP